MAFYDGLGKRIQQSGQGAIDWTKKSAETARLNGQINNLEKEINSTYTELGKAYYQKNASTIQDEDMIPYFQKIDGCLSQIRQYKDQISTLKGRTKCINCGMEIDASAAFCNYCGAQQVPDMTSDANVRRCPNCGQILKEGQAFCTGCGQKVEIPEPVEQPMEEAQQPVEQAQQPIDQPVEQPVEQPAQQAAQETPQWTPQRICPNCGREVEADSIFCTYCGQKYEEPMAGTAGAEPEIFMEEVFVSEAPAGQQEGQAVLFCVNCGAKLDPGDAFCTNCGHKVVS